MRKPSNPVRRRPRISPSQSMVDWRMYALVNGSSRAMCSPSFSVRITPRIRLPSDNTIPCISCLHRLQIPISRQKPNLSCPASRFSASTHRAAWTPSEQMPRESRPLWLRHWFISKIRVSSFSQVSDKARKNARLVSHRSSLSIPVNNGCTMISRMPIRSQARIHAVSISRTNLFRPVSLISVSGLTKGRRAMAGRKS